ncbi:MAG: hypothetical protein MUE38_06315 [Flavihumibacter sp.]|nr:hypothetical protein [Flavihumibacter sp.]
MKIDQIIEKYIGLYVDRISSFWEENPQVPLALNEIYFNSEKSVVDLIKKVEINNFYEYKLPIGHKANLGDPDTLSLKKLEILNPISFKDYDLFDRIECKTREEVNQKYPSAYFLIHAKYSKIIDAKLISLLPDYKKCNNGNRNRVIDENLSLVLDWRISRERAAFPNIEYEFPEFVINFKGEEYYQHLDITNLAFIGGRKSFNVFYDICMQFYYDSSGAIYKGELKEGQPVVYFDNSTNLYVITNSKGKIVSWNNYISTVMNLYYIHFTIFESWLIDSISKEVKDS